MSRKDDPKNSWDDDQDAYQQAQKLKKYDTPKDKLLQALALAGVICIAIWFAIILLTRQFMPWHYFLIGIGLLLISFTIINNVTLIPRIKRFSSRSDLRIGHGTVKCCFMTAGIYVGGAATPEEEFTRPRTRVGGSFKLIVQGENGKLYKTTAKTSYGEEEPVTFYYAEDSDLCALLEDEEAKK